MRFYEIETNVYFIFRENIKNEILLFFNLGKAFVLQKL